MEFDTTRLKHGPQEALDIAYNVCTRYYEMGCPETIFGSEEDSWYSEGPLSRGSANYKITGLEAAKPNFEYTEKLSRDSFKNGAEAHLSIVWGRGGSGGPGSFQVSVSYPDDWEPVKEGPTVLTNSFKRRFVPDHVTVASIPHLPANQNKIFEWLNTFVNRPRDATAAPGIEFFAGPEAVEQIKSEILNILISDSGPDIIAPEYLTRRLEISFECATNLLKELYYSDRVVKLEPSDRYHCYELYGSVVDLDKGDTLEDYDDDELVVKHRP